MSSDSDVARSTIANRIMRDPSVIEDGLRITNREKQTRSGAIDLYGIDRDHAPDIIEIMRSQPTPSAVIQLKAYVLDHQHRHTENVRVRGDTLHTKHISHDTNTTHRERTRMDGVQIRV